jgi:hypothetical protein
MNLRYYPDNYENNSTYNNLGQSLPAFKSFGENTPQRFH